MSLHIPVGMSRISCDKFNTLGGSGCCMVILDDIDKIQLLSPSSITRVVLSLSELQRDMHDNQLCSITQSEISCNGQIRVALMSTNSRHNTDFSMIKRKTIEILLSEWLSRQGAKYSIPLLSCMSRHCDTIEESTDLSVVNSILMSLMDDVNKLYDRG